MSIKFIFGGLFGAYAIGAFYVEMYKALTVKKEETAETG